MLQSCFQQFLFELFFSSILMVSFSWNNSRAESSSWSFVSWSERVRLGRLLYRWDVSSGPVFLLLLLLVFLLLVIFSFFLSCLIAWEILFMLHFIRWIKIKCTYTHTYWTREREMHPSYYPSWGENHGCLTLGTWAHKVPAFRAQRCWVASVL